MKDVTQGPYSTYSTYWKTIDVEGIGIDGLGYTVTITADGARNLPHRRSKLRKFQREHKLGKMEEKDIELVDVADPSSIDWAELPSADQSLWQRLKAWSRNAGLRRLRRESAAPIEIKAVRSIEVVEETVEDSTTSYPGRSRSSAGGSSEPTRFGTLERGMSAMSRNETSSVGRSLTPPIQEQQLMARRIAPVIQAPVASRRISADFVNVMARPRVSEPQSFYHDSDDEERRAVND